MNGSERQAADGLVDDFMLVACGKHIIGNIVFVGEAGCCGTRQSQRRLARGQCDWQVQVSIMRFGQHLESCYTRVLRMQDDVHLQGATFQTELEMDHEDVWNTLRVV